MLVLHFAADFFALFVIRVKKWAFKNNLGDLHKNYFHFIARNISMSHLERKLCSVKASTIYVSHFDIHNVLNILDILDTYNILNTLNLNEYKYFKNEKYIDKQ